MRTPEFIERCMANGIPLEMALKAAKAFEAECALALEELLTERRQKERARQAKHRAKKDAGNVMSRDTTLPDVTQRDLTSERVAQVVIPTSSLRSEVIPPVSPNGLTAPTGAATARGGRLPDDWNPLPDYEPEAFGLDQDRHDAELAKFRDYWRSVAGAKGRKADWPATWRNWMRRAAENPAGPHERNRQQPNNRAAGRGVWSEIIAEHDGAPARDLARAG